MEAAVFTAFDGPDAIETREQPDPDPGPSEAIVEVEATSINNHDLYILEGKGAIGSGEPPFVSGVDLAGTVERVGSEVTTVSPGDRVVLCPNQTCGTCQYCREGPENTCEAFSLYHGAFADRARVDASRLVSLPPGVDVATAGVLPVSYMTAWHMLRRADVSAGDRVFVPGATGGVGTAAVLLADVRGAEAIGTTTSERKADQLRDLGVDHVVESGDVDEIRGAVEGVGEPDAVLNHLSGPYTDLGLSVMRRGGTLVSCGASAGGRAEIDVRDAYLQHKRIVGSTMGTQGDLETVLQFVADGRLEPAVGNEYALANLDDAFRDMRGRDLFGKARIVP